MQPSFGNSQMHQVKQIINFKINSQFEINNVSIFFDFFSAEMIILSLGYFIYSIEPFMMAIDIIVFQINSKLFVSCIEKNREIDGKLLSLSIPISYGSLRLFISILLTANVLATISYILFAVFQFNISIFPHVIGYIPLFITNVSKIWFFAFVTNIRMKLNAMSMFVGEITEKLKSEINIELNSNKELQTIYLHNEIKPHLPRLRFENQMKIFLKICPRNPPSIFYQRIVPLLCKTHGEIHVLTQKVNAFFGISILLICTFVFALMTCQLYMFYYKLNNQNIPHGLKMISSFPYGVFFSISTILLISFMAYSCWQTKEDSRKFIANMCRLVNCIDDKHSLREVRLVASERFV